MKDLSHKNFISAVLWKIKESTLGAWSGRRSCFRHGSFTFYLLCLAVPQSSAAPGPDPSPGSFSQNPAQHPRIFHLEASFITSQTHQIPPVGLGGAQLFRDNPFLIRRSPLGLKELTTSIFRKWSCSSYQKYLQ